MITKDDARVIVSTTVARGLQTMIRQHVINLFQRESHVTAAGLVVASAEAMVTTGMRSKADFLAVCEAAFDHAVT